MEQLFYEMMETGVGPAKFIGFLLMMIFAGIKLFFMIAVICACNKYIHKD